MKLCYSKWNCVIQNEIMLFKMELCYSKWNVVIQNGMLFVKMNMLFDKKTTNKHKMSVSTIELPFEL